MSYVIYNFSIFFTIVRDFADFLELTELCGTQGNPVRNPEIDTCPAVNFNPFEMLLLQKFNEILLQLKKTITTVTIENLSEIMPYFQN